MVLFRELEASAQAAYSELYEAAQHAEVHRSVASLQGSFQAKTVKQRTYWYYAFRDALQGKVQQIYVGPDSPQVQALRARAAEPPAIPLDRPAAIAIAAGCATIIPKHFRIIRQLADSQFFRAGGLLVGSHAYIAMGNMLGVRWEHATATLDIDFAVVPPTRIALALPADLEIDVASAIESLDMGFLPSLDLGGGASGTYVSQREPGLRLDFLTPKGRKDQTVRLANLNLSAQPLPFLEYLLEQPAQAALLSGPGAVVVNLPDPGRFALHKILVAGERPLAERAKAAKDLMQAASILAFHLEHLPTDVLRERWADLARRGRGWTGRFQRSFALLAKAHPDIARRFAAEVAGNDG